MRKPILKTPTPFWLYFGIGNFLAIIFVILALSNFPDKVNLDMALSAVSIILLFYMPIFVIAPKVFISKIMINSDGVERRLYGKRLKFIKWEEINGIYIKNDVQFYGRVIGLDLSPSDEEFFIGINKRRLKLFISLCPVQKLKEDLQRIKFPLWKFIQEER